MKFSLSNLALLVLVFAFAFGFLLQKRKATFLEAQNRTLETTLGFKGVSGPEQFNLMTFGYRSSSTRLLHGAHLLRVMNHAKFQLEVTKYHSSSKEQATELVDINDPMIAITYIPFATNASYFSMTSTYASNKKTDSQFNVADSELLSFSPCSRGGEINRQCILVYFFNPDSKAATFNSPAEGQLSTGEVIGICDANNIDAVFFRLVER